MAVVNLYIGVGECPDPAKLELTERQAAVLSSPGVREYWGRALWSPSQVAAWLGIPRRSARRLLDNMVKQGVMRLYSPRKSEAAL